MNPLATALNATLATDAPAVLDALSTKGRASFFPFGGILGQAAQARGRTINATIGIALGEDGSPMRLPALEALVDLPAADAFKYAPSFGKPALRDRWAQMIREKNPSLGQIPFSRPVVTCALTHALSMTGYLFLDPGDTLLTPDLFWGNYRLIFSAAHGVNLRTWQTFDADGGFNVDGLRAALAEGPIGKRVVSLNFPNNPTGYTLTEAEAGAVTACLVEAAEAGNTVVALIDDAYFGLVYGEGVMQESIFTRLASAHERLLAVKIDGATKEDYAWGFRVGFMTYAWKGATPEALTAMESKTAGAIRGNISNAPHISQSLLLKAYEAPEYAAQKAARYAVLKARFDAVVEILETHPEYAESFEPLPFNSGYFMCVRPKVDAEAVRQRLLEHYDTGIIATAGLVRVAFSSAPLPSLGQLFENLHRACQDVAAG